MEFHVNQSPEAHYTVYKLTSPMGKIYIGCTGMKPKKRWNNGNGYRNLALNADIQKYGWDAFKKEILCEKLTKEGAEGIEKKLIERLKAQDPKTGYNIFTGGACKGSSASARGRQHMRTSRIRLQKQHPEYIAYLSEKITEAMATPEYREAARQRRLDYIARTGDREFRKPIPVICIETGAFYPSLMAAERATGVHHMSICSVCNGIYRTAGNLHWEFA